MQIKPAIVLMLLVPFSLLSAYALWEVGYLGIFTSSFNNWGTVQVLCDLVVICTLAMLWMVNDARARGLNAWPYVVVTVLAGSFGPLLYLLKRGRAGGEVD